MKKTLYLFLSLLLCFALFACTQEPSTTPNEVETITPNEPEVPIEPEFDEIDSFPVISEKFLSVLKNDTPCYSYSNIKNEWEEQYFFQWLLSFGENATPNSLDGVEYTLLDMNNDGDQELILRKWLNFYVLSDMGERIERSNFGWGHFFPKKDGTWVWHYWGAKQVRVIRIKFENDDFSNTCPNELCYTKSISYYTEKEYFIDEEQVSEEEYIAYDSQFSDEDISFYSLEAYMKIIAD